MSVHISGFSHVTEWNYRKSNLTLQAIEIAKNKNKRETLGRRGREKTIVTFLNSFLKGFVLKVIPARLCFDDFVIFFDFLIVIIPENKNFFTQND